MKFDDILAVGGMGSEIFEWFDLPSILRFKLVDKKHLNCWEPDQDEHLDCQIDKYKSILDRRIKVCMDMQQFAKALDLRVVKYELSYIGWIVSFNT